MKKLTRLRERWSDRRVETPTPKLFELEAAEAKASYDHDTGLHDTELRVALCKRCQDLQIGTDLEQRCEVRYGTIATITIPSLDSHCNLCQQFRAVFNIANDSSTQLLLRSEFDLSRQAFTILDERGTYYGQYLCIHLQHSRQDIRLLPAHGLFKKDYPSRSETIHPLGNFINPTLPDLELARQWLRTCRESHASSCMTSSPQTNLLRLIDCRSRQLVEATHDQRYICLSYVWGCDAAEEPTAQAALPDIVPKTVEDAMFVAINLDIPFLWVDRYCIDQDNVQEKHSIIRNMDRIYQGAEVTIIASVGDDPHHGLPGVRGTPRQPQYRLQGDVCTYVAAEEVAKEIKASKWNSRGWTYQEMLLSRRRLVFPKSQMYSQCTVSHEIESLFPRMTSGPFKNVYRVFPPYGIGQSTEDLKLRLCEYYRRQLSYEADIVDAFAGIVNAFQDTGFDSDTLTQFYGVLAYYNKDDTDKVRISFLIGLF